MLALSEPSPLILRPQRTSPEKFMLVSYLPRTNLEKSSVLKCLYCLFANLSSRLATSHSLVYHGLVCFRLHMLLFTCLVTPNAWNALLYSTFEKVSMPLSIFNSCEIIPETILCKFAVWLFECSLKSFTLLSFQMSLSITIGTSFTWVMSQFILNVTCIGAWTEQENYSCSIIRNNVHETIA